MGALPASPPLRDALVAFGVWLVFRLLRQHFSLREVVIAAILIGFLHFGSSGAFEEGAAGPYTAQFVGLCSSNANADAARCRCAKARLERSMSARAFDDLAFKFYVDRRPPPELREALSNCSS
jgi:hypothetical protein